MRTNSGTPFLVIENMVKAFPGTVALKEVNLEFRAGQVYGLVGENGAGKSTLVKILSGEYVLTSGNIYLEGKPWTAQNPKHAENCGIVRVPQEPSVIPDLSVAENMFLGHPPKKNGMVDYKGMQEQAKKYLNEIGVDLDVTKDASTLSVANQQMMLIASTLVHDVKLIILDEPTASITEGEAQKLFKIVHQLKAKGVAIIFISHRLEEVFEICDYVYVLRDGGNAGDLPASQADVNRLIGMMVGRKIQYSRKPSHAKPRVVLEVENLCRDMTFENISFKINEGEILGIAGLMGAGRTELARAIFGADKIHSGKIRVDGKEVKITSPQKAIALGIGFATEDRKDQGLFLIKSVKFNTTFNVQKFVSKFGFINDKKEDDIADEYIRRLDIKTPSKKTSADNLSGGNQQKVILARWLAANPKILILDEPTRGIDVGAKQEVHELIRGLAEKGVAIIVISSELPEIMSISDRIIVMYEGRISGEIAGEEATEEAIVRYASGYTNMAEGVG